MSSTEALHSFLRWRKIMKMFCSAERSCKLLLQESFCNFSFKDFFSKYAFPPFLFFSHYLEMRNVVEQSIKVSFYLCPPPLPTLAVGYCERLQREGFQQSGFSTREAFWVILNIPWAQLLAILWCQPLYPQGGFCALLSAESSVQWWIMWKHHSAHPHPKHQPQTFPFPKSDSSWRYGVGKMVRTWANKPDYNLEQLQILLTTFFASNAIEPITMAYPPLFKLAFVCPQAHCQTNLTHHHNKMRSSYKYTYHWYAHCQLSEYVF